MYVKTVVDLVHPIDVQPVAAAPRRDPSPGGVASPSEPAGEAIELTPDAFLLRLSTVARKRDARVQLHQDHGRHVSALLARREATRKRRLIVEQALEAAATEASEPERAPVPAAPAALPAVDPPAEAWPSLDTSLLERISAYKIGPPFGTSLPEA